jgi:uncharacterized protein YecT (DUF1311 family)
MMTTREALIQPTRSLMRAYALAIGTIAVLAAFTLPAAADDAEIIATCVQAERDANRTPLNCVGRVSDPCLQSDGGQSTRGMVDCTDKETKVWDQMLNEEYGRLLGILNAKAADEVRKAQRRWISSRDADCKVPYEIFEGGTMAQPVAANCMLTQTADRAVQVRAWREMAQPQ